ncbi:MAG: glycine cleavage system protein GcvH [Pirellulales bacterium]|nr:glycine cleavage system protein GcvH [Pirellulales bacterium]
MSQTNLHYAKTHEWVRLETSGEQQVAVVGISAFAVEALTDLVHMQLSPVGKHVNVGDVFGEIESVKAVSDLYSPVAGEIIAANTDLANRLETLNTDPYNAGWLVKIKLDSGAGTGHLLDHATYEKECHNH